MLLVANLDEAGSAAEARAGLLALALTTTPPTPRPRRYECLIDTLVCHLRFPSEHRKRIHSYESARGPSSRSAARRGDRTSRGGTSAVFACLGRA